MKTLFFAGKRRKRLLAKKIKGALAKHERRLIKKAIFEAQETGEWDVIPLFSGFQSQKIARVTEKGYGGKNLRSRSSRKGTIILD